MRSLAIVKLQIGTKVLPTVARGFIRFGIGPLAEQGLDEALGLAVGPRRVGPRPEMAQLEVRTRGAKESGHVAAAVIAHHPANDDAPGRKPGQGPAEKGGAGGRELVGQDLDVGDATVVIDGDVHVLPADAAPSPPTVAVDPVADAVDAAQRLDIDMWLRLDYESDAAAS